jgi:hypothetical protein
VDDRDNKYAARREDAGELGERGVEISNVLEHVDARHEFRVVVAERQRAHVRDLVPSQRISVARGLNQGSGRIESDRDVTAAPQIACEASFTATSIDSQTIR